MFRIEPSRVVVCDFDHMLQLRRAGRIMSLSCDVSGLVWDVRITPQIHYNGPEQYELDTCPLHDEFVTAPEIAETYNLTPAAVRAAAREGRVRAKKSGATWLISQRSARKYWG